MKFVRGKPPETPNAPYRAARVKDESWRSAGPGSGIRLVHEQQHALVAALGPGKHVVNLLHCLIPESHTVSPAPDRILQP
jgi:hypothetical protein